MNKQQLSIIILFLIIIVILTYLYITPTSRYEMFANGDNDGNDDNDIKKNSSPLMKEYSKEFTEFKSFLDRYKTLDIPITINNVGGICDNWENYDESKYALDGNKCLLLPGKSLRQCLVNDKLTSCNNYYRDGLIDKSNEIDTDDIYDIFLSQVDNKYNYINEDLEKRADRINKILDTVIQKRNMENQQLYFIEYNDMNVNDKKTYLDKTTDDFNKLDNDLLINQVNFSNTIKKNKKDEINYLFYYNILKYIIYITIIVGILNLMFSNIL
jgi:hypothetical protein